MNQNKQPKEQHYIPRVYLKQFRDIALNGSFTHCVDFSNKYNTNVQTVGLNDAVFKIRNFYTDKRLKDPYLIEKLFSQNIEPLYEEIMKEINLEGPISKITRENIMLWLYSTNMRAPYRRWNSERIMNWVIEMTDRFHERVRSEEEKERIKKYVKNSVREIQHDFFIDKEREKEHFDFYYSELVAKHWRILKSTPTFPFWTSDNPGFSPNTNQKFSHSQPFHPLIELNSGSIVFFVLSPKYCLEITPFLKGTPVEANALNINISFKQAPLDYIDFINRGVFHTKYKLVISDSKKMLKHCININR